MKCGFYELDITPSIGSIIPGGFAARYADSILEPLFVRAVVFDNGKETVALAVADTCGITLDLTERVRARVGNYTDIKPENVMFMGTHAHGAGPTLNWGEEVVTDEHYLQNLVEKSADAIYMAWKRAEESELVLGKENIDDISFIRVFEMKDGSLKTNPTSDEYDNIKKPCAEIDPELYILAAKREGEFVGAVINFATHPATVATNEITGDYISYLSREMKKLFGMDFVSVFINGACGDINHINPYDPETNRDRHETCRRVGRVIAEKSAEALKNARLMTDDTIKSIISSVTVKLRKPSVERLIWAKEWYESLGDEMIKSTPSAENYWNTFFALQTLKIQADKNTKRDIHLQLFRVGDAYIFGNPCQMFVNFGKKVKSACDGICFFSDFANDYQGYVPTPECMKEGVYEATLAPTSALEAMTGDIVTDELIEMYRKIK